MDLNRSTLLGRTTTDVDCKTTAGGQTVSTFGFATNRTWKDASGEQKSQADFHNIVVWGKLAEICRDYVRKGKRAYVEGSIQTRSWEDNNGGKHYKTEIVASNVILLDPKPQDGSDAGSKPKSIDEVDFN